MEKMEYKGSVIRIRECVFDLLALEEDLGNDDWDDGWWALIEGDLRLKTTFLYCDLSKVISVVDDECKEGLTHLANKLFYYMEQLDNAVKSRSVSVMQDHFSNTVLILQQVVAAFVPHDPENVAVTKELEDLTPYGKRV